MGLAQTRSLDASSAGNNSTCVWHTNVVTEKDGSSVPFFLYFIVVFGIIKALETLVDMRQLALYKKSRREGYVQNLFDEKEF